MPEPIDQQILASTRQSYDTVAEDYAKANVPGLLERHPLERAMLDAFAELVRGHGDLPVADLGCGAGNVTAYLRDRGLDVFGVDLSTAMVDQARRIHPDLSFEVGSMTSVDRPDGALIGIVSTYSIIHLPSEQVQASFREWHRLLAPGGHLLLVFQVRPELSQLTTWFDHTYPELDPDDVSDWLLNAGFRLEARLSREPDGRSETLPRASLMAVKPIPTSAPPEEPNA